MKSLLVAVAFLTRVPVGVEATASDVRLATRWFPAVGVALGAAAAALLISLGNLDIPPLVSATLVVATLAGITGAIHLDGLADTADGFGGGRNKDDVLRIMHDPRIGSFGAVALVLVLALKISTLATLIERHADIAILIVALTLSRWTVVALGAWLPYARAEGGVGEAATSLSPITGVAVATVTAAVASFGIAGVGASVLWAAAASTTVVIGLLARSRIGGVTGDVFGATVELSEAAVLLTGLLVRRS